MQMTGSLSPVGYLEEKMTKLFGYSRLAEIIGVHERTLKNWYSRDPARLPPAVIIPGAKGPRWTDDLVDEWIQAHVRRPAPIAEPKPKNRGPENGRRRGRPRLPPLPPENNA
jgi:hypothetical protein